MSVIKFTIHNSQQLLLQVFCINSFDKLACTFLVRLTFTVFNLVHLDITLYTQYFQNIA